MTISKRFFLYTGTLFFITGLIFISLLNMYMRQNALMDARQKAREMIDCKLAIHSYFSQQLKPSLFKTLAKDQSSDYFDPTWMSSTFAIREMSNYSKSYNKSGILYKECAINARSPLNEANPYEKNFIKQVNQNPDLVTTSCIQKIKNQNFLVVLRRGEVMEAACMRCHSDPDKAPGGLTKVYGTDRGFYRKKGTFVSAISIRIPLDEAYASANHLSLRLSGIMVGLLIFLFLMQYMMNQKWIFKPLAQLQDHANLIISDKKNLGKHLKLPQGKELKDLTQTFNHMSCTLKDTMDNLDTILGKRTKKLTDLNNQLLAEIAARQDAEKQIKASSARYKGIFENTKNGIAVYRAVNDGDDFIFVEFNRGGEIIEKVDRQDLIGHRLTEKFPGVRQYGLFTVLQRVWKTGQPEYFPLGFYQDGRVSGWRDNYVYRLDSGEVVALYNDETDRKKAEEALALEKERLFVTLQSIGDGVIATDQQGTILLINRIAEQLTGWTASDAIGKQISQVFKIINEQTRKQCRNPVDKVMNTGRIIGLANHTMLVSHDGTERMIADSGAPIFNRNNEIIGVVLVFRDITQEQKIDQQLRQAQKMEAIGTLAGGIAHDFNNMLGVVTGNTSYAKSLLHESDELFQVLSDIQDAIKKAQELTLQLLTFSKGGEPIKKITNLHKLIIDSAKFVTRGSSCKCQFDIAPDLWSAEVDSGQIHQVISNIVINASQAMPEGGVIDIAAANISVEKPHQEKYPVPCGKYVKIAIKDYGIGIAQKHMDKIFNPYFTTKQKGSGLGLATSYSIIKRHLGHIQVHSQLNQGSVFTIYLKGSMVEAKNISSKTTVEHMGQGKILIMDDDPAILKMAGRMFSRMGYQTEFATDGKQAIEMYESAMESATPFAFVILDLTVPGGMGGALTIPELLKIDPNIKAIVSSGYSNDPIMSHYEDYGFMGVIPKPYTKSQISEVLNALA
ncbi:MAG: multi-sensor hybrid histidine kinase [Candidatus Magnetoglobus multicellularis str. Araruama]|uniref:histidine kinase n=1 Tax=Candidatus Magnetoglobus multicellularis str. Araruama TaxID=890399 RepID=A0A1V1P1T4_9BACT|nr:MAG: multi-sensor hybrid histidine kinase [Candidatus Magnetoglobus multicellularis str. Araruama]